MSVVILTLVLAICSSLLAEQVAALSPTPHRTKLKPQSSSLVFSLQKCTTPSQVLHHVGSQLTPSTDPHGSVASLTLVRLCKQLLTLQNECLQGAEGTSMSSWGDHLERTISSGAPRQNLQQVIDTLAHATGSPSSRDAMVEGTKAAAVLARIAPEIFTLERCQPLLQAWQTVRDTSAFQPHQLSGLHWAYSCFQTAYHQEAPLLPSHVQLAYEQCNLPFCILPGCLSNVADLTVPNLVAQVPFQVDTIQTTSTQQAVPERRETAWLGDEGVEPFAYSGKSMPRHSWSPLVESIRDALAESHGHYYDGCLLNHYPDGGSAMRYHIDPDQGRLWDFHTAVVSVGASRRVAFRSIGNANKTETPHAFVVMHGDVMVMMDDCQSRFQHALKPADNKRERAARASLVFKKTLSTKARP